MSNLIDQLLKKLDQLLKKQRLYLILTYISVGLTIFSFSLWVYNLVTARSAWGLIVAPKVKTSALSTPSESSDILLYLSSIDKSTVTTALIFSFLFFIARGNYRIYQEGKKQIPSPALFSEHFPFPMKYKTYFVQLGLWGTVFAFIVAFSTQSGMSGSSNIVLLFEALGTALWSTFSAITLAFILCPPVEGIFSRAVRLNYPKFFKSPDEEIIKTANAIDKLSDKAELAAGKLTDLTKELNELHEEITLEKLRAQFNDLSRQVKEDMREQEKLIKQIQTQIVQVQKDLKDAEKNVNEKLGPIEDNLKEQHEIIQSHEDFIIQFKKFFR
jgi:hypothetical protein